MLTLVAGLVLPTLAFAQQPTTTVQHQKDVSDTDMACDGPIAITGQLHTIEQTSPTTFRFKFHEFGKGVGTGPLNASWNYQYQNQSEQYEESSAPTFQSRFSIRKHIIRTGSPKRDMDDYFETIMFKSVVTNGRPVVTIDSVNVECR